MKSHLFPFFLCFFLASIFISCSSSKKSLALRKADIQRSKETSYACFVQLNDGTIKTFNTLKLITGPFITPHLLGDGNIKIRAKDIRAYQNKDHYAISQSGFTSGRRSYVAVESLPGFAVRVIKGEVNVYSKKYYNGLVAVDEFFLQSGDDGPIVKYSPELISELSKQNPDLSELFCTKKNIPVASKVQKVHNSLNRTPFLSKNK